jgi:nucleotide-binding universal stress UspA family protein
MTIHELRLSHIMAATDESDAGRQAVRTASRIAARTGAKLTVLRVMPFDGQPNQVELERLRRWVEPDLPPTADGPVIEYAVAYGLPGIEIGRTAERMRADLLVIGRKPRTRAMRLLLGDTADAVARRSRVPCLFVTAGAHSTERVLVAADGSTRAAAVLQVAEAFAGQMGAELRAVTVERRHAGEPLELARATPAARTSRIQSDVTRALALPLTVRHGEPAEQIVAAVGELDADVLVVGCHRGGPAGVIEAGSTARQVIHGAPCSVLTVPL